MQKINSSRFIYERETEKAKSAKYNYLTIRFGSLVYVVFAGEPAKIMGRPDRVNLSPWVECFVKIYICRIWILAIYIKEKERRRSKKTAKIPKYTIIFFRRESNALLKSIFAEYKFFAIYIKEKERLISKTRMNHP